MILYHFTCSDAAPLIEDCGHLLPYTQHQLDGRRLIWLTDLEAPTRTSLGLTSWTLACDRMEYRVTVDVDAHRWVTYVRDRFGSARSRRHAMRLSQSPGALPMHWLVAEAPVPVLSVERVR